MRKPGFALLMEKQSGRGPASPSGPGTNGHESKGPRGPGGLEGLQQRQGHGTSLQREIVELQRMAGNRAVTHLVQRLQDNDETASGDPVEAKALTLFEELLDEFSPEELMEAAEQGVGQAGPTAEPAEELAAVAQLTVQRAKKKKKAVRQISSAGSPDMTIVGLLETKTPKEAKLINYKLWLQKRKKHARTGYRKYAAIRHQNLMHDTINEDLVLLIRLKRQAKLNKARDRHYSAIEAKGNKKGQTPQHRTELLGEVVAATRMEQYLGVGAKMLVGYLSGPGIDQLWVVDSKQQYWVVEAKGPGAGLTTATFAVRGATGQPLVQMSKPWIANRIPQLRTQHAAVLQTLLTRCGLQVSRGGNLEADPAGNQTYTLHGLVVTAGWNPTTGAPQSSLSGKTTYTF